MYTSLSKASLSKVQQFINLPLEEMRCKICRDALWGAGLTLDEHQCAIGNLTVGMAIRDIAPSFGVKEMIIRPLKSRF